MSMAMGTQMKNFLWILGLLIIVFFLPGVICLIVRLCQKVMERMMRVQPVDGFWACPECGQMNQGVHACEHCRFTPRFTEPQQPILSVTLKEETPPQPEPPAPPKETSSQLGDDDEFSVERLLKDLEEEKNKK